MKDIIGLAKYINKRSTSPKIERKLNEDFEMEGKYNSDSSTNNKLSLSNKILHSGEKLNKKKNSIGNDTKISILINSISKITKLHKMEAFYSIQNYSRTRYFIGRQFVQLLEYSMSLI